MLRVLKNNLDLKKVNYKNIFFEIVLIWNKKVIGYLKVNFNYIFFEGIKVY